MWNRRPGIAASLRPSADDQGTTRVIVTAYSLAAEMPLLLRRLSTPRLPPVAGPAGLVMQIAGLSLRSWSMRTLGASYTRTLRTEQQQAVVTAGPYRVLRHPGYAGSLLTWVGFACTSRSVPTIGIVAGLLGYAYTRRILAEEELLQRDLAGYADYRHRTKRLVPLVW